MSESKWTKEPWMVGYGNGVTGSGACCHKWHEGLKAPVVYSGQGEYYADKPHPVLLISAAGGLVVAHVIPEPDSFFGGTNGAANARLIAAAPDEDAALVCCVKTLEALFEEGIAPHQAEIAAAIRVGRAALKKARGEA